MLALHDICVTVSAMEPSGILTWAAKKERNKCNAQQSNHEQYQYS
jgi:hypothetical protein